MTYKLPEPVQIDKHIPTGIVIRGYTAKHVLDAYTAGVTQTKAKYEAEVDSLAHQLNRQKQWKDAMRDRMIELKQQNKDLIKTNVITQKEFDELLKDYNGLREDYIQLEFELNVVNSRE